MSEVANIYDNGPLSLIARIKDTISVWTAKKWSHYRIEYAEPWPRSEQTRVDLVALNNVTAIAANGTLAKLLVPLLQVTDNEMLCIRFEPLDDVQFAVWEQPGTGRFVSRNTQSRIEMATKLQDPYMASSTFCIMGFQREMNLEVFNPNPIPLVQARAQLWGYRYILEEIMPDLSNITQQGGQPDKVRQNRITKALADGDKAAVQEFIGPTTWVPAEGR